MSAYWCAKCVDECLLQRHAHFSISPSDIRPLISGDFREGPPFPSWSEDMVLLDDMPNIDTLLPAPGGDAPLPLTPSHIDTLLSDPGEEGDPARKGARKAHLPGGGGRSDPKEAGAER